MKKAVRRTPDRSAESILYLVKQAQYKAYVRYEAVLQPLGVTAVQFRILMTLARRPKMSSAELARVYDVKPQTMIKQIAMLEAKGLIGRRVSDANKRLLELSLTPAGDVALKQLRKDTRQLERKLMKPFSADEQDDLRSYLLRLINSMSALPPPRKGVDFEEPTEEFRRPGVQRL